MPPEGSPKRSKIDFQRRLGLKTRFLQKLSLGLAKSIKHWCSSSIQYLYFHDTNPLHWLARIHLRAPKLIVTDEFGQEFWSLPKEYQGKVRGYPTAFKMQSYVLTSWPKFCYSKGYKKVEDVLCESLTFEMQSYNFKDFDQISSKNLNFDDANPVHWLARIHLHAPKLIVTDEFTPEFWWCPKEFRSLLGSSGFVAFRARFGWAPFRLDETLVFDINAKQSIRNGRDKRNNNINNILKE